MRQVHAEIISDQGLDTLEPRTLLAAGLGGAGELPFVLYYPEGYSHDRISEFVPITNPNGEAVTYQLLARYETGERDQVIAEGVIPAQTRGGVTICRADTPGERLVRADTPYALVLRSSAPVDATLSHYDFGATIGQSFTGKSSNQWAFGSLRKDRENARDFVVFYNTADRAANVRVTAYTAGGPVTFDTVVDAHRRGGINVNDHPLLPEGTFAMTLDSDAPLVAATSSYSIAEASGYGVMGVTDGGTQAGIIPSLNFEDNDRGHGNDPDGLDEDNPGWRFWQWVAEHGDDDDDNGDGGATVGVFDAGHHGRGRGHDRHGHGGGGDEDMDDIRDRLNRDRGELRRLWNLFLSWLAEHDRQPFDTTTSMSVLNAGEGSATVTFNFVAHDGETPLENAMRTVTVPAGTRATFEFTDLGFALNENVGVVFTSDAPVVVSAVIAGPRRSAAIPAITIGATEWGFGEGFMSRSRAGVSISEELFVYNPSQFEEEVTIEFLFSDGTNAFVQQTVAPGAIFDIPLHDQPALLERGEGVFFGMRVTAAAPIIATLDHLDRVMGGGFTTPGIPGGDIVALFDLLNPDDGGEEPPPEEPPVDNPPVDEIPPV